MSGQILFYAGIIIMGISVVGGVVSAIVLRILRKRLQQQLEKDYGKKIR